MTAIQPSSELAAQTIWPVDRIKDHARKIGSGITPTGGAASYLDAGIPLLRSQNVHFDGLRLDDVVYIAEDTHEEMRGTKLRGRDVLLNITGASIGRCTFVPAGFGEGNVNQHVCIIRPAAKLNYKFLTYCLSAPWGQDQVFSSFTGASRQGLGQRDLGGIQVPLPPPSEQQRIAAYLDASCAAIDAAVAAKRRQLETLDALRKSIIQRTITNGLDSAVPRKPTDSLYLSAVPTHWAVRSLKQCADILNGYAFDSTTYVEDGVPIIRIGDVAATIDWTKVKRVPPELLSELARFIIQRDDILIALTGATIGKSALYCDDTDALLNQRVAVLRASRMNAEFLNYIIQTHVFTEPIDLLCSGGAQDNIGKGEVGGIKIPVPPLGEQESIVGFLNEKTERLFNLSGVLETQIATLTAYRKSLIHECVTGQRRITEADLAWVGRGKSLSSRPSR